MKKKFAQYFTPPSIADFMIQLTDVDLESAILEPSCGEGVFLEGLNAKGFQNITAYEIDQNLAQNHLNVQYESFVSAEISEHFDLVIGNPPYIRWKHLEENMKEELLQQALWKTHCNRLCDYLHIFILRAIELLNEGGQLIFICPEYWMNTTHSQGLRDYMVKHGYFERIYQFKETPIFGGATVACIIFKYIKYKNQEPQKASKSIKVWQYQSRRVPMAEDLEILQGDADFTCPHFEAGKPWLLIRDKTLKKLQEFEIQCTSKNDDKYTRLGDVCEIANGMVSGLDKAFQWQNLLEDLTIKEQEHLLKVVKAKHLQAFSYQAITPYLFLNEIENEVVLKLDFPNFYAHLQDYRSRLEKRYQFKRKIPYWRWTFPRSWRLFSSTQPRILVPCKERISNKDHFRFAFAEEGIYPTQDVTALLLKPETPESIYYVLAFLNLPQVFHWLRHKGIVKGSIVEFSERPLASLAFRKIDWDDATERNLHDEIVKSAKQATLGMEQSQQLKQLFTLLLDL